MTFEKLALVGTGMIGGSLALALRQAGRARRIVGYDRAAAALERARALGIVDEGAASAADAAAGADLVVLAVPVGATESVCRALAPGLGRAVLVTDVGSTKVEVLAAVERALPFPERFVGAHPIAGTERSGPEAATATLFRGRRCLLTPTAATLPSAREACAALWEAVGARVEVLDAAAHDQALALVSHLPHAAAFALAAAIGDAAGAGAPVAGLWGGGFVDTTRIAGSDPEMWRDIFLSNRDAVAAALARLGRELDALGRAIADGDGAALEALIARARTGRRRILEGER
jgi:prephenate dehydrogenase